MPDGKAAASAPLAEIPRGSPSSRAALAPHSACMAYPLFSTESAKSVFPDNPSVAQRLTDTGMTVYDSRMTDHLRRNSNPRNGLTPMTVFYPQHTGVRDRPRRLSQSRERSRPLWRPVARTSPFAFFRLPPSALRPPSFRCPPPSVLPILLRPPPSVLPSGVRSSTFDHAKPGLAHFHRFATTHFDGVVILPSTYGKSADDRRAFFVPTCAFLCQLFTSEGRCRNSAKTTMPEEQSRTPSHALTPSSVIRYRHSRTIRKSSTTD